MANQRAYEQSHSFVDFRLDLRTTSPETWALLGEAKSKSEHVGRALLSPQASRELMQVYLAKGFLATTAIEGNTLSEDEVRGVLEGTLSLPPSREYLAHEIENVIAAYNKAKDVLADDPTPGFSAERLREYNRLILDGLELDEDVVPGEFRQHSVVVGRYRAVPAADCEYLIDRLCDWLDGSDFDAPDSAPGLAAPLAIVKAIVAHLYVAWIHPFGDGNGRTARLLELQILQRAGFPLAICQLLSNHYNQTRTDYYRQLDATSRAEDESGFIAYAVQGFVDQLREQLDVIRRQQSEDRWEQFVYQTFGERRSESDNRRLRLILEISRGAWRSGEPVPRRALTTLTPELARAYATKTEKTLTRDLNAIEKLELLRREASGLVPADDVIRGLQQGLGGVLSE
jgi:cell filamentation protein, protein adenylyltransferase